MNIFVNLYNQLTRERETTPDDPDGLPTDVVQSFADSRADKIKDFIIEAASMLVPIVIVVALISSNGYFFSGFQTFTLSNFNVTLQWTIGAAIELGTAGLLFGASRARKKKNSGWWIPLIGVCFLMTISIVAQYMYLRAEWLQGAMQISNQAVDNIPIFGWLVGLGGMDSHGVFFLLRSLAMHGAEVLTTFLLVPRGTSIEKMLERQRKVHEYKTAQSTQDMALSLQKSIRDVMQSVMKEQQLLIQERGKQLLNGGTTVEAQPDFQPALLTKGNQQSQQPMKIVEIQPLAVPFTKKGEAVKEPAKQ